MSLNLRAMRHTDLAGVWAVQCAAYPPKYHEPKEALASHLALGPQHCFVVECASQIAGYVFSHPWQGTPPELHIPLGTPGQVDHLFIHDLAVAPSQRGKGIAGLLLQAVQQSSQRLQLPEVRLVAVGEAKHFWAGHGFELESQAVPPECYGSAVLMRKADPPTPGSTTSSLA
ncbi:GNAT family N-acetyltransferase [Uliginosibacterium gangwonense]|uniref:GNAT family N-acetyltransferase n=1 Tax=Uliginosibacterium gangwonense TaxID=392736 RepID=UPI0003719355|nr:N-acetyltransferase [Uliginosibacterium gangwonense]